MKSIFTSLLSFSFFFATSYITAQDSDTIELSAEDTEQLLAFQKYADSIDDTMTYQYGNVQLGAGIAEIQVPEGYKFLDKKQANYVLSDLWGNPDDDSCLGMLLKEDESPAYTSYAVEVSYSEEGYIEDEDAADLDYDDLLEEMQDDAKEVNPERIKLGYPSVDLIGWASTPFYDEENKKLHWAKELKFGGQEEEENTLNYNIRVLGRKGYINLNVIGTMDVLPDVKDNIDPILTSVAFLPGYQYADFNPEMDEVAAYGIGGLIAGKVLAKAGFFALIVKFWKFIAIGVVAFFGTIRKKLFGGKSDDKDDIEKLEA